MKLTASYSILVLLTPQHLADRLRRCGGSQRLRHMGAPAGSAQNRNQNKLAHFPRMALENFSDKRKLENFASICPSSPPHHFNPPERLSIRLLFLLVPHSLLKMK